MSFSNFASFEPGKTRSFIKDALNEREMQKMFGNHFLSVRQRDSLICHGHVDRTKKVVSGRMSFICENKK